MIKKQCKSFFIFPILGLTVLMLGMLMGCTPASPSSVEFHLKFDGNVSPKPVTGRVYVLLHNNPKRTPMYGPNPLDIQPFYARDVKNWKPGEAIVIDDKSLSWTIKMDQLKGEYAVQAILDFDTEERSIIAPGNGTSKKIIKKIGSKENNIIEITIDQVVKAQEFKETELIKEVNIPGQLLSDFYGRTIRMQAAVILPPAYHKNPQAKYPAVYVIPGWGGTHYHISMADWNQKRYAMNTMGLDKVFVFLSHECPTGYHCFVDSENNGPRSKAMVEEFIPYIEKNYRVFSEPSSRFLTGMSSGAWAALWLQIAYPDFFGGVWAVAPDPVDFRANVGGTNIYEPDQNIYYDKNGNLRPLGREKGKIILTVKEFVEMEIVYGDGEQMFSFEGTFSKRGPDGRPQMLFDRKTGKINPEVAEQWKKYDLRIILEKNWQRLGPKLAGKLHTYVAEDDTFFMDWSLKRLKESLNKMGSDAVIKFVPSGGHGDDLWKQVIEEIHQEMDKRVLDIHPGLKVRPNR